MPRFDRELEAVAGGVRVFGIVRELCRPGAGGGPDSIGGGCLKFKTVGRWALVCWRKYLSPFSSPVLLLSR